MNVIAEFNYVNKTQGYRIGDDEPQETRFKTSGELFKFCMKEYGRCVGKVYIDPHQHVGWVFEKKEKYTDCDEYYVREVWVIIHTQKPEHIIKEHFAKLN